MPKCISINQKQNQIIIKIAESATQTEVTKELKSKIKDLKKMYKDEKTPVLITGKALKNKEIDKIQDIITAELEVEVEFESSKVLGLHGIKRTFEQEVSISETKYIKESIRSGKKIEYDGSIVILGDVNGGAEIIASENIVVLGILRGVAHAGAKGNKKAIIAAENIDAPQLRIANVIKEIEKDENKYKYAFLNEETIVLE